MRHRGYGYLAAAATAAVVTLSACGGADNGAQTSATTPPATSSSVANAQSHNGADMMFARMMIPHHQQAIDMSDMLLSKSGIDPQVVTLANDIKMAQTPEIQQMQEWLKQWSAAGPPPSGGAMPGHDMPGNMPGNGMPGMGGGHGMMSAADMSALQNAQGLAASKLFLTQMIEHHKGAIAMAQQEVDNGEFPPAVAMAQGIRSSQQEEITTMQKLVQTL